jgi:hypothetical protein
MMMMIGDEYGDVRVNSIFHKRLKGRKLEIFVAEFLHNPSLYG